MERKTIDRLITTVSVVTIVACVVSVHYLLLCGRNEKLLNLLLKDNPRLEAILENNIALARQKGFAIETPGIKEVKPEISWLLFFNGAANLNRNLIIVASGFSFDLADMNEVELNVLVAHELGHIIHQQDSERFDLFVTGGKKYFGWQDGDVFAALLHSEEAVKKFREKYDDN